MKYVYVHSINLGQLDEKNVTFHSVYQIFILYSQIFINETILEKQCFPNFLTKF